MRVDDNRNDKPNYWPNRFDDIEADKSYKEPSQKLDSNIADWYDRNENDDDHYTQPGLLFRKVMTEQERQNTINNIVGSMQGITGDKRNEIIKAQLSHFNKADEELAKKVAEGLGFNFQP